MYLSIHSINSYLFHIYSVPGILLEYEDNRAEFNQFSHCFLEACYEMIVM